MYSRIGSSFHCFGVGQLSHADDSLGIIEPIQKFLLDLLPTVDGFGLHVNIPVTSNTFQHPDEPFYHQIVHRSSIVTCFNEMYNMLFWVALSIKLLEL